MRSQKFAAAFRRQIPQVSTMTEERHDKDIQPDLDEYLDGNSPESAAYRELEQPEPPAALDRAVLQAARDELTDNPVSQNERAFWRHWMRPLSAVALMGVCLAVVLEVMDQQPQLQQSSALMTTDSEQTEARYTLQKELSAAGQPSLLASPESKQQPNQQFADELETMADKAAVDKDRAIALDQIMVTARKTQSGRSSAMLEEIVVSQRGVEKELKPSPAAWDAWAAGAHPAADVWLAGIQLFYAEGEVELADAESAKLNLLYPGTTERARTAKKNEKDSVAETLMSASPQLRDQLNQPAIDVNDLPNPHIWAAGIEWLHEQGDEERAEAEFEKFSRIYPDYDY
jgi:hypothetical protein